VKIISLTWKRGGQGDHMGLKNQKNEKSQPEQKKNPQAFRRGTILRGDAQGRGGTEMPRTEVPWKWTLRLEIERRPGANGETEKKGAAATQL